MELGRPAETACIGLIFGDLICLIIGKLDPPTPISKRKRAAPSPTSSANSVIGEKRPSGTILCAFYSELIDY
ncbi:hypothetical protein RHGRI_021712 [Rhododendron griersonianum]|uniref:Uncharacterized protein n=1 Tax=Rhododendron griersonianum TaxID=479676 RepID=A0AAV6JRN2_9ERIC|nr:hypothetical protein RHGRI_021712 [Rhododendron griersonianum]